MKRSEMIKELSKKLICPHVIIEPGIEKYFESKAKSILDFLEEKGMIPPHDGYIFVRTNVFAQEQVNHYKWEEE